MIVNQLTVSYNPNICEFVPTRRQAAARCVQEEETKKFKINRNGQRNRKSEIHMPPNNSSGY